MNELTQLISNLYRQLKRLSVADRTSACLQESLHLLSGIGDRTQPLESAPANEDLNADRLDLYSGHSFARVPELGPSDLRAIETVLDLLEPGDKPRGPPSSKRLLTPTFAASRTSCPTLTPELAVAYLRALCFFLLWLDARNRKPREYDLDVSRMHLHRRDSMKHTHTDGAKTKVRSVEEDFDLDVEPESASALAEMKPFLPPAPPPPFPESLGRHADDIAMSIRSSEVASVNDQMFDAESKTASESVQFASAQAQQMQLSQYESLVGSAGAWHEGHSARGQLSDAQLRLLEQRFADNIKSILEALRPLDAHSDADAAAIVGEGCCSRPRVLSASIEVLLLRCYLEAREISLN